MATGVRKMAGMIAAIAIGTAAAVGLCVVRPERAAARDLTMKDWGIEHFDRLDVGIYWYSETGGKVPMRDCEPKKDAPTLIFAHGWKPQGQSAAREGLSIKDKTIEAFKKHGYGEYEGEDGGEFYASYLRKGWNVGAFYWNQLADAEADPSVAIPSFGVDDRIWTANGGRNMRYATYGAPEDRKGRITEANDPTNPRTSVACLFGDEIVKWLGADFSGTLRIAGHSMGGQLALATSEYLCRLCDEGRIGRNLLPERIALIDPYFSALSQKKSDVYVDSLGRVVERRAGDPPITPAFLASKSAEAARKHGIPIEGYVANVGMCMKNYETILGLDKKLAEHAREIGERFRDNCVWVFLQGVSKKYGGFDPTHVMSVDWYFHTANCEAKKSKEGLDAPCAALETEKLHALTGLAFAQNAPKGVNPFYYERSEYSLIDFPTMLEHEENAPRGAIAGRVERTGMLKNDKVSVEIADATGKIIDATDVDDAGYFRFRALEPGAYSARTLLNGKPKAERISVRIAEGDPKPVEIESEMTGNRRNANAATIATALAACLIAALATVSICLGKKSKQKP